MTARLTGIVLIEGGLVSATTILDPHCRLAGAAAAAAAAAVVKSMPASAV